MYSVSELNKYKGIFHAFSVKKDGNMSNSILGKIVDYESVVENRKKFLKGVGVDINKCVCMWVTHGDEVVEVPEKSIGTSIKDHTKTVRVDGLMTNIKGIYLFLLIADCLPIIFYDPEKEVIALIHAGWKGVDLEIARKAVEKMNQKYGCNPGDLIVGIGPCAHKESFIKENPDQKNDLKWKPFLERAGNDKYEVDLIGLTKKQLIDAGVIVGNIYVSEIDTVKDKRFFSHVREGSLSLKQQGRFACVVGLK